MRKICFLFILNLSSKVKKPVFPFNQEWTTLKIDSLKYKQYRSFTPQHQRKNDDQRRCEHCNNAE